MNTLACWLHKSCYYLTTNLSYFLISKLFTFVAMMEKPLIYLNIAEQQQVRNQLKIATEHASLGEKLFFSHGDKLAGLTILASSFFFWRSGFRAFHLNRYGKGRIQTLLASATTCMSGCIMNAMCVRSTLTENYRPENQWNYGFRSIAGHQVALFLSWLTGTGINFSVAQKHGLVPLPQKIFSRENRGLVFDFIISRIRPYRGVYVATFLSSTLIMFFIGIAEFRQSKALLAKINRKTFSVKED